ncbi:S9 family peptidase [Natrononativus amylolyticus]|uniref:S9 family peptidase n=1 Tax=Natrononativus amylolyticus TaxID=2963434 RepID=UPI0020CFC2DD|nr:S9 family peptidase [Natrononativus amylolyticus]
MTDATVETDDVLETLASLPEVRAPVASPDGGRVAFYYDETGRNELYVLDLETGARARLSDGEVPRAVRYPIRWHPDGDRLFFHRDEGGDEQNDVFSIDLEGAVDRVVGRDGQCVLADVGPDGRYLYYASDARDQLNLYRHDLESGEFEQLTAYDQPVRGVTVGPVGDRIAYATNESDDLDNQDVYVADADGSNARNLEVGDHGAEASPAAWHPDGDRLLVSDNTEDLTRCGVYDLASDEVTWYGGDAEESPVEFLPDGSGFLALRTRRAAVVPIRYDLEDDSAIELDLPEGVSSYPGSMGGGNPFLEDETVLVTQQTSSERKRLLAYDLASDESEVLVDAEYGGLAPDSFVDSEYVTYESRDGVEIGALLYEPAEPSPTGIVHVHGGPHGQSRRRFSPYVQFLVQRGYTVLQPNYRGSVGRGREFKNRVRGDWGGGEQADVANAGRWLADREGIEDVAVMGGSYGGYSAFWQLVSYPEVWSAGVARVGITDLLALYEESMPHFKTILEQQLGDPEENADFYRERSPLTHVENIEAPICIVHGVNDPRCPISQARLFRDALEAKGWTEGEEFAYHELGAEGHGSSDIEQKIRTFEIVDEFLGEHLPTAPRRG